MSTASIFISYRIADTLDMADRLAVELRREFGKNKIFFDRRTVEAGDVWNDDIKAAAKNAKVVLVLIGKKWLTEQDEYGDRRLNLTEDWVRLEVEEALKVERRTVPVLVNDAEPPPKAAFRNLPTLAGLASQQATKLCTERWDSEFGALVQRLAKMGVEPLPEDARAEESLAEAEFPPGYRDWVRNELADISLLGVDPKEHQATLRQVYVPAMTQDQATEQTTENPEFRSESVHLLSRLGDHSLYASGAPGSGKTTFCKWLALLLVDGNVPHQHIAAPKKLNEIFPEPLRDKLPVFVRLRDFYPKHKWQADVGAMSALELQSALAAWIDSERPGGLNGDTFSRFLAEGRTMLMLDGFDEVASSVSVGQGKAYPRAALLAGLCAALPEWQTVGNRVLLTSRPYGLSNDEAQALALVSTPLVAMPTDLQRLFVQRWFATVLDHQAANLSDSLWAELGNRRDLAELRDNPMLLTAMCVKYQEGKRLPADVTDMYEALVSYVLHNRYHKKSADVEAARRRLGVLALAMHCGRYIDGEPTDDLATEPRARISLRDIDRALHAHNDAEKLSSERDFAALAIREDLLSNSGLLLPGGRQE